MGVKPILFGELTHTFWRNDTHIFWRINQIPYKYIDIDLLLLLHPLLFNIYIDLDCWLESHTLPTPARGGTVRPIHSRIPEKLSIKNGIKRKRKHASTKEMPFKNATREICTRIFWWSDKHAYVWICDLLINGLFFITVRLIFVYFLAQFFLRT